jgi:hypothetical protein
VSIALLACLALLDAAFVGFRDAAGRSPRIDKRAYFRRALARGSGIGVLVLALFGALAGVLLLTAGDARTLYGDFEVLAKRLLLVYGTYALAVLGALAVYARRSLESRTLATVLVLGPCTMIRPYVIVAGALWAALSSSRAEVMLMALVSAGAMLVLEPVLGRRWRRTAGVSWE